MRPINPKLEKCRVRRGPLKSDTSFGNNGAFAIRCPVSKRKLNVVISDQGSWEHVSVSVANAPNSIPTWDEMCFIKDQFWQAEECVIQFHPPKSVYKNIHSGTLHLWRPLEQVIMLPPLEYV